MRRLLLAAVGAATVLVGGALAAAVPVSPGPGARYRARIHSSVGLCRRTSGRRGSSLRTAPTGLATGSSRTRTSSTPRSSQTTSAGGRRATPLYAGHYWWLVWSSDRTTAESFYSSPTDFTIPVSLNLFPVKTVRSTFLHLLAVRVRWTTNVHALTVRARVLKRKRVVWQNTQPQVNKIGFPTRRASAGTSRDASSKGHGCASR